MVSRNIVEYGDGGIVIEVDTTIRGGDIQVSEYDYPNSFIHNDSPGSLTFGHASDLKVNCGGSPITPDLFLFSGRNRLFLHASIKIEGNRFTNATFLLDSTCTSHFVFSKELQKILKPRITRCDEDLPFAYISTMIGDTTYNCYLDEKSGRTSHGTNLIGLPMFSLLGLQFKQCRPHSLRHENGKVTREAATITPHFKYF